MLTEILPGGTIHSIGLSAEEKNTDQQRDDEANADEQVERDPPTDIYCPACNYHLRGVESNRCPECGLDITDIELHRSRIPWVHRREMGRMRAYWRTVWMVTVRPRVLIGEIGQPAHLAAARRFRWATIPIAFVPFLGVAAIIIWGAIPYGGRITPSVEILLFYWSVALFSLLCCMAMLTAIPHYALRSCHVDVEVQHRAAVLCLYAASAPLAWMFVGGALLVTGMIDSRLNAQETYDAVLMLSGGGMMAIAIGLAVIDVIRLIKRATDSSRLFWGMTLKIVALCLAGAVLTLGGIPAAFVLLAFVYYSFH